MCKLFILTLYLILSYSLHYLSSASYTRIIIVILLHFFPFHILLRLFSTLLQLFFLLLFIVTLCTSFYLAAHTPFPLRHKSSLLFDLNSFLFASYSVSFFYSTSILSVASDLPFPSYSFSSSALSLFFLIFYFVFFRIRLSFYVLQCPSFITLESCLSFPSLIFKL